MLKSISIIWLATLVWSFSFLLVAHSFSAYANETDRLALLAIKSQIHDPLGVTSSWNTSVNLCQWTGVTCGHRHQRVIKLDLKNQSMGGSLSPYVGNLSFLRFINLGDNNFDGAIPNEIGRLSRLDTLVLANNSFSGKIPTNLSRCSNLINFLAHKNKLVGEIPADIGYHSWLKLEKMSFAANHLTGQLPPSIGNLSALQAFDVGENRLDGTIPESLGQLKSLKFLNVEANNFTEYGMGGEVSVTGDVYSFGIMLLEMFTRRRPTDEMFNNGQTLHGFARMALPEKVMEIVDPSLLFQARASNSYSSGNGRVRIEDCLVAVVRTAVLCSTESPSERIKMIDVVAKLHAAREMAKSLINCV